MYVNINVYYFAMEKPKRVHHCKTLFQDAAAFLRHFFVYVFFSSFNPEMSYDIRKKNWNITQDTKQINDKLRISDGLGTQNPILLFWSAME